MTKTDIFEIVVRNARDVLPTLTDQRIAPNDSLKALGANSLDRSEIVMMTLEALELTLPLAATAGAKNIDELVKLLHESL
jgi:polyketide biosynthesis acyl carrier protein